jgi:putative hydrolase of the HAD superfamily
MRSLGRPIALPASADRRGRVWLIDLDDTLHDAQSAIMPRINQAMTEYVARHVGLSLAEAGALRRRYWERYGATLLGMIIHHQVDPHHYLRETHPFPDLERLVRRSSKLARALARLPGRRVILTNAPWDYARRVVRSLGIASVLEGIVPIETMRFAGRLQPKPSAPMMRRIAARLRAPASRCTLVEDSVNNLARARAARVATVLVTGLNESRRPPHARSRAGSARPAGLQVQSISHLARRLHARAAH